MELREKIKQESIELCSRFGIKRLGIFGSVARGEDTSTSDIDFFVEFESPTPETLPERYFGFTREAASRFNKKVQLLTPAMLRNPHLKKSVEKDLVILYG